MAWWHPAMPSWRLHQIRFWALRAAEQSREYGEPEAVWAAYVDSADRIADLLGMREHCRGGSGRPECAVLRLRANQQERNKRNGCFYPLCALSVTARNQPVYKRF